jgi:putative oxidoreductase
MQTSDRVIALVLALIFLASGGAKLAGLEFEVVAFERWGYPLWFMYATGMVEVAGGILLLIPRTTTLAATGLAVFMIGAVGTHVLHAEWAMLALAGAILLLAARQARRGWARARAATADLPIAEGA